MTGLLYNLSGKDATRVERELSIMSMYLRFVVSNMKSKNRFFQYPVSYYQQLYMNAPDKVTALADYEAKARASEGQIQFLRSKRDVITKGGEVEYEVYYTDDEGEERVFTRIIRESSDLEQEILDEEAKLEVLKRNYIGYLPLSNPNVLKVVVCLPGYKQKIVEGGRPQAYRLKQFAGVVQCASSGKLYPDVELYTYINSRRENLPPHLARLITDLRDGIMHIEKSMMAILSIEDKRPRGLVSRKMDYRKLYKRYPALLWVGDGHFSGYTDSVYYWKFKDKDLPLFKLKKKQVTDPKQKQLLSLLYRMRNGLSFAQEAVYNNNVVISMEYLESAFTDVKKSREMVRSLTMKRRWRENDNKRSKKSLKY